MIIASRHPVDRRIADAGRRASRLALLLAAGLALPAIARAGPDDEPAFKFTAGHYASSDGNPGTDLNLRGTRGAQTGWIGVYQDRAGLRQWRAGLEHHLDGEAWETVFSLQNASGGTWVGSVTATVGGDTYAIVGWGRTNLRPYVNLNFDPNDAITLGVGTRAFAGAELSLFQVRDDRLSTGQTVTHLVWRQHLAGRQRLTVDLFAKRGLLSNGAPVSARSISVGWDWPSVFVRFAHDPAAGFAPATQNRVSTGFRF